MDFRLLQTSFFRPNTTDIERYIALHTGSAPDLVALTPLVVPENRQLRCRKLRFQQAQLTVFEKPRFWFRIL